MSHSLSKDSVVGVLEVVLERDKDKDIVKSQEKIKNDWPFIVPWLTDCIFIMPAFLLSLIFISFLP